MVENEGLVWEARHEFQSGGQLLRIDEDVVGEPKLAESSDALEHRWADEEPLVGLVLCDMADSDKPRMRRQRSEAFFQPIRLKVYPADDSFHARVGIRQTEQPPRFGQRLTGLDGDGSVEAEGAVQSFQVGGQPIALKG